MSKDSDQNLSEAQKGIEAVTAGIRSFEDYNFLIFDRAMYESKKPLDIEDDTFQTKSWLTKLITSQTEESAITKKDTFQKYIDEAISKGASQKDLKEIQERVNNYPKEFKERFSSNEKANFEMQKYMRRQIINNSIDLTDVNGGPLNNNKRSTILNKILENNDIPLPKALYKKYTETHPDLRPNIVNHVVENEIKKFFGKEEVQENIIHYTLDESKLTPENITNFKNSLNDKLEKANDKLIATEKLMDNVKAQNPDLTDTQIQQFDKALSKLDTKNLIQHKDTLVNTINEVSKTKLGFAEKIYTMVTGKDQEVYLNNKIDEILDKRLSSIISSQTSSVQSPSSQSANIKQVLNSPTSNFAKTKEMQKSMNREKSSQSADIKQVLSNPTRSFAKTKEMQKAINRGSMINTSSSISVPITPNKSISNKSKQDERSR